MLSVRDVEEAAARKEEKARRRTERERAKAQQAQDATGNIPDDADGEREERPSGMVSQLSFSYISHAHSTQTKFTSHSVPSKPSNLNLVRRTKKVPPRSAQAPTTVSETFKFLNHTPVLRNHRYMTATRTLKTQTRM